MVKPMVPTVPTVRPYSWGERPRPPRWVESMMNRDDTTLRKHEEHEEHGAYAYRTFAEEQAHGAEQLVPVGKVVDVGIG